MRTTIPALLFLTAAAPLSAQNVRPMTVDDGLDLVRVGPALIAPDGDWVLYAISELDWADNRRKTTWYRIPAGGGEPWRYLGDAGGSRPAFSPDGAYLAFARPVDKKAQLFVMRTDGGEAVQLTTHQTAVGAYRWAGSGRIVFLAPDARPDAEKKEHDKGDDAILVDEGPNGQREGSWNGLWTIDLDTRDESRLTGDSVIIGEFDVASNGTIACTVRHERRRNQGNLSEIVLFNPADSSRRQLTHNRAPERGLVWAPDATHLAYLAPDDTDWELKLSRIRVVNVETGATRMVSGGFDGNVSTVTWTPDSRALLFNGLHGTNTNLYRVDLSDGTVTALTGEVGTLRAASFSRDRRTMVYTFQDFDTPPDLYVSPTGHLDPVRLTRANPWVEHDRALAGLHLIHWKSRDGLDIEGLLALPPGYDGGHPLPLLLHIHGGPAGVFTNSFRTSYHVWAGLGYAQLMPNVRGSSGYTDALLRGNLHDIGDGDYWDLMTGVDTLIARGIAHPDSLALRGWSYGGILGGWTITHTTRFRAASIGAMVSDWTSEYGPGFNYDVRRWYIGGTPWENPDGYRRRSALTHVAAVTTPTILFHGMNDRTDTEAQSMNFFAALKDQGKTVRYLRFPREPHGFREPRHQRRRDIEEIRWIQRYARGIDWTPWERAAPAGDSTVAPTSPAGSTGPGSGSVPPAD